jgi:hypothetical protein
MRGDIGYEGIFVTRGWRDRREPIRPTGRFLGGRPDAWRIRPGYGGGRLRCRILGALDVRVDTVTFAPRPRKHRDYIPASDVVGVVLRRQA